MIYHNHEQYMEAIQRWDCTLKRISPDGNGYVFVKGEWILESEYLKYNSKPCYERQPKENPDGTVLHSGIFPKNKSKYNDNYKSKI